MRVRAIVQRAKHGGQLCRGENGDPVVLQATRPCNTELCEGGITPQDCELGEWTEWTACSSDTPQWEEWAQGLGSGQRTQKYRTRKVAKPSAYGGRPCESKLKETAPCKIFAPEDGA